VRVKEARAVMNRIGQRLLHDRKAVLAKDEMGTNEGRDLLSMLVRANGNADPMHRLSDEEVLARKCSGKHRIHFLILSM
jgi:cytochrome P450